MNTPRDLLFARHQAAIPKLDALRRDVVAGLGAARRRGQTSLAAGLLPLLWRELIRPCRQTWTALAAVWVVLFIVNAAQRDGASACRGQSPPPVPKSAHKKTDGGIGWLGTAKWGRGDAAGRFLGGSWDHRTPGFEG
jgi:hypothetical protein